MKGGERFREAKRILVLCALPYTNNVPHVGTIVGSHLPADTFARYCRLKGKEVIFIGGTDENGAPTEITARELGVSPKELCDTLYEVHKKIYDWLKISYDNFSRTSKPIHHETTREFFQRLYENGYISEGELELPYCENCKLFLPDRYVEGKCPYCGYEAARGDQCENCGRLLDPHELLEARCKLCGSSPKLKKTKHLFLELSKVQRELEEWITSNEHWNEFTRSWALGWIKEGLKRRCITRDLTWGVRVPLEGYEDKVFYVWFDAPIGYISSTKEWAKKVGDEKAWERFWKDESCLVYNFLGKDNIPFHTVFWPGMLIAHGNLNLPFDVIGLHYCNYEGRKISKSKGWGVFCDKLMESDVNSDVWRFYFTFLIPETGDTEFRWSDFERRVNTELVGNLANFVYRTLSFAWKYFREGVKKGKLSEEDEGLLKKVAREIEAYEHAMDNVRLREGLTVVLRISSEGNKYFQEEEPWKLVESDKERCSTVVWVCLNVCKVIGILLRPFLPETSEKILSYLNLPPDLGWRDVHTTLEDKVVTKEPKLLFEKLTDEKIERLKKLVTKPTPLEEFFGKEKEERVSFEEFKKIRMRVGKVVGAERVKGSRKLLRLLVDFGGKRMQAVAGLGECYSPEELEGKKFVFVTNLEKKRIFGIESECMILAAVSKDGKKVSLLVPESDVEEGSEIL